MSGGGSDGKESACKAGDPGSSPRSGRSPEEGHGNPLFLPGESHGQRILAGYSPWDRKSWTQLSYRTSTTAGIQGLALSEQARTVTD